MEEIIARLLAGDRQIVDQFMAAKQFWDGFYAEHAQGSDHALQKALGRAAADFCRRVAPADPVFALYLMVLTALGSLYETHFGFDRNQVLARRMIQAFEDADLRAEIKGPWHKKAVKLFGLADKKKSKA